MAQNLFPTRKSGARAFRLRRRGHGYLLATAEKSSKSAALLTGKIIPTGFMPFP